MLLLMQMAYQIGIWQLSNKSRLIINELQEVIDSNGISADVKPIHFENNDAISAYFFNRMH
jgi:hypothetical protein